MNNDRDLFIKQENLIKNEIRKLIEEWISTIPLDDSPSSDDYKEISNQIFNYTREAFNGH